MFFSTVNVLLFYHLALVLDWNRIRIHQKVWIRIRNTVPISPDPQPL
jgi:hypothetical protein